MTASLVPQTLNGWTYSAIQALCAAGQSESDRHDFKLNLPEGIGLTKLCCAFANTAGGFVIIGVKDSDAFDPIGITPDKELYGRLLSKIKATPDIAVSVPLIISVPETPKVIYVFEVAQSTRRPHLPAAADQRVFWKRQGSDCVQMTLEEIRFQMSSYEEKLEKLTLLLIDLRLKARSLEKQAILEDGFYNGDVFSFEIIDRVVAESYSLLKEDLNTIGALDTFRSRLQLVNAVKQKMIATLALSYDEGHKNRIINEVRDVAKDQLAGIVLLTEQIERSFKEKFGIDSPYAPRR